MKVLRTALFAIGLASLAVAGGCKKDKGESTMDNKGGDDTNTGMDDGMGGGGYGGMDGCDGEHMEDMGGGGMDGCDGGE